MAVPSSTYRLQIRSDFDLYAAAELTSYLAALGVGAAYLSPLLRATAGSSHGYDTVDHSLVDPERGGEKGRQAFTEAARAHGLGIVVDIVPNHVGVSQPEQNPWWWDLLTHGRGSEQAGAFDVDWDFGNGRLRIPVLGDDPTALDDLRVEADELRYFDHRFPIAPGTEAGGAREVHDRQHYELVSWRRADYDLNYRRFFAVSDLAAVRVEVPTVFDGVHREVLRWVSSGDVDGIRLDHPDGLADPGGYLDRLTREAPATWLLVEKILELGERLPSSWMCAGTTGYDALAELGGVFVDPAAEPALTALDTELSGTEMDFGELAYATKRSIADGILRSEVLRLTRLAADVPAADDAIAELLACFPVYRSYLPEGVEHLEHAESEARRRRPDLTTAIDLLAPRLRDVSGELAVRFQQTSGMVMAKGVEDTAFYRWSRLTSLNEVGGDPRRFALNQSEFHSAAAIRLDRHPASMTTLSTHDTKRSEDVRARISVISELPDEWAAAVRRWNQLAPLPDAPLAHLLWQAVVGAWPISRERLHAYAEKAAREAGVSTGWNDSDEEFELLMHALVDGVYDDPTLNADLTAVVARLAPYGWSNSLSQKLVQLTGPGIPDVYQGSELWEQSLVDPDNRRPVDFQLRRELLERIDGGWLPEVDESGAAKLLVTSRALRLRRERPDLFGGYLPLQATGQAGDHLLAFDRGGAVTLGTRLPVGLDRRGGWGETTMLLPGRQWTDILTGTEFDTGELRVADALARYPVALLVHR